MDLRLYGPLLVNGAAVECPTCGPGSLYLDRNGPRETWPARIGCLCGWAEDHAVITNGLVQAALNACTGRRKATDVDTFEAEWRGTLIRGERYPELCLDDIVAAGRVVADTARKEGKKWWHRQKRDAQRAIRSGKQRVTGAATRAAGQAAGAVTAAAMGADWQARTGGAGPVPRPRRARCRVPGCRGGWVTITTRIHGDSGKTEERQVPCAQCHRA